MSKSTTLSSAFRPGRSFRSGSTGSPESPRAKVRKVGQHPRQIKTNSKVWRNGSVVWRVRYAFSSNPASRPVRCTLSCLHRCRDKRGRDTLGGTFLQFGVLVGLASRLRCRGEFGKLAGVAGNVAHALCVSDELSPRLLLGVLLACSKSWVLLLECS